MLVAFDEPFLDSQDAINVNVDQKGLGVLSANLADRPSPKQRQEFLEVKGVAGTCVDTGPATTA